MKLTQNEARIFNLIADAMIDARFGFYLTKDDVEAAETRWRKRINDEEWYLYNVRDAVTSFDDEFYGAYDRFDYFFNVDRLGEGAETAFDFWVKFSQTIRFDLFRKRNRLERLSIFLERKGKIAESNRAKALVKKIDAKIQGADALAIEKRTAGDDIGRRELYWTMKAKAASDERLEELDNRSRLALKYQSRNEDNDRKFKKANDAAYHYYKLYQIEEENNKELKQRLQLIEKTNA